MSSATPRRSSRLSGSVTSPTDSEVRSEAAGSASGSINGPRIAPSPRGSQAGSQTPRTSQRGSQGSVLGSGQRSLQDLPGDVSMSSGGEGLNDIMNSPLTYGDADLRSPASISRRFRPDINSATDQRRQLNTQERDGRANTSMAPIPESDAEDGMMTDDAAEPAAEAGALFIWGTNISVSQTRRDFRYFLEHYGDPDADESLMEDAADASVDEISQQLPLYLRKLREIGQLQSAYLNVDLKHVQSKNERLYRQIITYPAEILPYLDMTATSVLNFHFPEDAVQEDVVVRPFNALKIRNMRDLDPQDIDQLITVCGMVIRASALIPEPQKGYFECSICKFGVDVDVHRGRIEEPTLCTHCNTNHSFVMIHNRSVFTDKQLLKIQEAPEEMPSGQTPHTVSVYVYMDLVDSVQPGDRVTVTGLFRAAPIRLNPRMRTVKSIYRTHIDAVHFQKKDDSRLHSIEDGSVLSTERIEKILRLSRRPDIYDRLSNAVAPNIFEHDDIKKGILCLLFSGTKKDFTAAGRPPCRSEINMLLCGDPGTSKSQLLQYVHELVPRSQYTSGKGSSAVGLTAYLTKDVDTKQLVLQTGALVLSDNGVCCIDEFDKMNDSTRSVLHEVMEQQTMSIAKAGIISQLNARASILAAANPVDSQWNQNKTIIENVQLPHTLLSRFDLIFLMLDPQLEAYDRRLAQHLVSLYYQEPASNEEGVDIHEINLSLFRDYIQYAKAECEPRLTEDACENLMGRYAEMRRIGRARGNISAFPRQLESLIRLSEAHAKIRLSKTVESSDVDEAYRLHREALKQSAVDPVTGLVDPGMLASGTSTAIRRQLKELGRVIRDKLEQLPTGIHVKQLYNDMRKTADQIIRKELFDDAIAELIREDAISRDSHGRVKVLFRAQRGVAGGAGADSESMAMG